MIEILIIVLLVMILSIINIIKPFKCDGSIKLPKKARSSEKMWNFTQRLYSIQALVINAILLVITIVWWDTSFLGLKYVGIFSVLLLELLPVVVTVIVLAFKKDEG